MIHIRNRISLSNLLIFGYLMTVIGSWAYGHSYILYVVITLVTACFTYGEVCSHLRRKVNIIELLLITVIIFSGISMLLFLHPEGPKSFIMINSCLLFPVALSYVEIDYAGTSRQLFWAEIICLPIVLSLSFARGVWNSNSLGFQLFGAATIGFMAYLYAKTWKQRILPIFFIAVCFVELLKTGSRNASLMILFCFILLLLPKKWLENPVFFKIIWIGAMAATVLAVPIMEFVFGNDRIMEIILNFTRKFSEKAWSMDSHLWILVEQNEQFVKQNIFQILFGLGRSRGHSHNIFYQCLFSYGIVGSVFIYYFYGKVFQMAYYLCKVKHDKLAKGCAVALVGHFLIQIAEIYMVGAENPFYISLIPTGIILQKYRNLPKSDAMHLSRRITTNPILQKIAAERRQHMEEEKQVPSEKIRKIEFSFPKKITTDPVLQRIEERSRKDSGRTENPDQKESIHSD